jgi:phytoene/squalene synthetase
MKVLFDNLSVEISKITTKTYSTSFSMGIYCLHQSLRNDIYSIYGFVRLADEIVDSFEGFDKKILLAKFKAETYEAIDKRISLNPILNSFQQSVRRNNIGLDLVETFFKSMEMDLEMIDYTLEKYEQYILGSAEVVGLMCLHVFVGGDMNEFYKLKPYAMKLGSAFQKVNFLRDIKDDHLILGRTYFPDVDISEFTSEAKEQIEYDIEKDFVTALEGIKLLPSTSRGGVYLAYVYYKALFNKIKKLPPKKILTERVRINNGKKLGIMVNCMVQNRLNLV